MKTLALSTIISLSALMGCAGHQPVARPAPPVAAAAMSSEVAEKWGIEPLSLHLSGSGYLVDFRYRVVDPDKARRVVNKKDHPVLLHEDSGHQVGVPSSEQIGSLRHTGGNLQSGKSYFVLFANPGRYIKPRDKVTLVMGQCRIEHMTVE